MTSCFKGTGHRATNRKTGREGILRQKTGVRYWASVGSTRRSRDRVSRRASRKRVSRTMDGDWKTMMAMRLFAKNVRARRAAKAAAAASIPAAPPAPTSL